jgi:hypothetical protein
VNTTSEKRRPVMRGGYETTSEREQQATSTKLRFGVDIETTGASTVRPDDVKFLIETALKGIQGVRVVGVERKW